MATIIDGLVPCADPSALYQYCTGSTPPVPTDWVGKANLFRVPMGRGPGTGGVLVSDFQFSDLDTTIDHTLTFLDAAGHTRTLQKITLLRGRALTPGAPENDHGLFLLDLADRRWHLARIPIDKAYNVSAADGLSKLTSSLDSGAPWTWQTMVQDLCTILGLGAQTLPFTPHGSPENFTFWGSYAWEALNQVLDRLACTIKYDIEGDTFAILREGDAAAAAAVVAANLMTRLTAQMKVWDGYDNEPARGNLPQKIRVLFPRRPQPTDGSSIYYTVDVALATTSGVETGTYEILHDDLTAVGAGAPTNATTLATRADERATDWLRKRKYSENRFTIVYRDFQEGMKLLAETTGDLTYDDASGAGPAGALMATEVQSGPDGLMERFRPYEQPLVLSGGGSGYGAFNVSLTHFHDTSISFLSQEMYFDPTPRLIIPANSGKVLLECGAFLKLSFSTGTKNVNAVVSAGFYTIGNTGSNTSFGSLSALVKNLEASGDGCDYYNGFPALTSGSPGPSWLTQSFQRNIILNSSSDIQLGTWIGVIVRSPSPETPNNIIQVGASCSGGTGIATPSDASGAAGGMWYRSL